MEYKLFKNGSYNIHTIKTDRFKNIKIEVIFRNNVDVDNIQARTLLFDILANSSNSYNTKRDINIKLEELYNASLYGTVTKIGSSIHSSLVLDILNPSLTKDDYLESSIKFLFDFIFNPKVKNGEFDALEVNTYKNYLKSDIMCIEEKPSNIAYMNALKSMDKTSITAVDVKGSLDTLETLTPSILYKTYLDILKHDYVDIFVIGDIDQNKIVDLISKYALFKTIKSHKVNYYIENKTRLKVKKVSDNYPFSQSHLFYIYNLNGLNDFDKKYTAKIYNMILGGGSLETKLSRHLREDASLCYGVYSSYLNYDNLLTIKTSLDKKNIKKAENIINDTVKDMNNITEDELNKSISSIITSLNASLDSPDRIIDNYYLSYLGLLDDIDERIKNYKSIKIEDVKRINKYIKLNTIYALEGEIHE